jgi:hypothetical protein
MGCACSREKRDDVKEGLGEVVKEMPANLTKNAPPGGGVTIKYDPTKTPEENAEDKVDKDKGPKPFNEKLHKLVTNNYPDGSVTMNYQVPAAEKPPSDD